jgi:hypothetical protein
MNLPIRASLLAAILLLAIAAPALADTPTTTTESSSTCRTDESTGYTHCFESETVTRTQDKDGATDIRISGVIHATVTDAQGNLMSSYDSESSEHDVAQIASDGSMEYLRITIQVAEEFTDASGTSCTRTHVVIRGGNEKINEVITTAGPC